MTVSDEQSIFGPPTAGDEVATLLGSLERQRATFAWKVGGLDEKGLAAKVGVSGPPGEPGQGAADLQAHRSSARC
jgi:hypothetical protein